MTNNVELPPAMKAPEPPELPEMAPPIVATPVYPTSTPMEQAPPSYSPNYYQNYYPNNPSANNYPPPPPPPNYPPNNNFQNYNHQNNNDPNYKNPQPVNPPTKFVQTKITTTTTEESNSNPRRRRCIIICIVFVILIIAVGGGSSYSASQADETDDIADSLDSLNDDVNDDPNNNNIEDDDTQEETAKRAVFQQECVDYYSYNGFSNRVLLPRDDDNNDSKALLTPTEWHSSSSSSSRSSGQFHLRSMAKIKRLNDENKINPRSLVSTAEDTCGSIIAGFETVLAIDASKGDASDSNKFQEWFSTAIWDGVVTELQEADISNIPSFESFSDDFMTMFYNGMTDDDLRALSADNDNDNRRDLIESESLECAAFMLDAFIETFLFVMSLLVLQSPLALRTTLRKFFKQNGNRITRALIPAIRVARATNGILGSSAAAGSGTSLTTSGMKSLALTVFRIFFTTFSIQEVLDALWEDKYEIGFGIILSLGIEFAAVGASGGTLLLVKIAKAVQVLLDSTSLVSTWIQALTECFDNDEANNDNFDNNDNGVGLPDMDDNDDNNDNNETPKLPWEQDDDEDDNDPPKLPWEPIQVFYGHSSRVLEAKFSPDGSKIASAGGDFMIRIWDWSNNGDETLKLYGHSGEVESISFQSDGSRLVSCAGGYWDEDYTTRVWDIQSDNNAGNELYALDGESKCLSVSYSANDEHIIAGYANGKIKIWQANNGMDYLSLQGHSSAIHSVAFHPDGSQFASSSDDATLKIWDFPSGRLLYTLNHNLWVQSFAYSPDGTNIVSASHDKSIRIWDTSNPQVPIQQIYLDLYALAVTFSPNGRYIAAGLSEYTNNVDDHAVNVYNASTGQLVLSFPGHTSFIRSVDFNPDGTLLTSSADDGTVRVWRVTV